MHKALLLAASAAALAMCPGTARAQLAGATIVPIDQAFAGNSMNHVAFRQNALRTVGDQQFAAYYDDAGLVTVARRTLGTSEWDVFNTAYVDNNSNLTDDHNVITFGVDGDGYMHLSWGMHNHDLRYIKSNAPVTGGGAISFGAEIPMVDPQDEGLVTYPQFYDLPGGDLLFLYRTGGSGNGDTQVNRYDNATDTWQALHRPLFQGQVFGDGLPSVNNYPNTLAFDSQGDIHFTWTVRDTPDFQTNKNIFYAKSTDDGATWQRGDGSAYPLPFGEVHSEIAVAIPEQSSLINQTSMTVDANDLPVVASWWAPGAAQGDHTRQYMLAYNDGQQWVTSQITDRAPEGMQGAGAVRELARPIVVVDDDNRVVVAMRYDERDDVVTIAHSEDRQNWNFLDLTADDLGTWEPNYDASLWDQENKLHLLYQPVGLGQASSTISVLEWDAGAYLDTFYGAKLSLRIDRFTGEATVVNDSDAPVTMAAYRLESQTGDLRPDEWVGLGDQGLSEWDLQQGSSSLLNEAAAPSEITLQPGDSFFIGAVYEAGQSEFGVDNNSDLRFRWGIDGELFDGTVEIVGPSPNNLTVVVDPDTGETLLVNSSDFGVSVEGYTIESSSGSLRPADGSWQSLEDAGVGGGSWAEANPSSSRVSELAESGALLLAAGDQYSLGELFDPAGTADLRFGFLLGGDTAETDGSVHYASLAESLPGDFNDDGLVDAADYTLVRDSLDRFTLLPNDLTPGLVSSADFATWAANYGRQVAAVLQAVPEPADGLTALSLLAAATAFRERANR